MAEAKDDNKHAEEHNPGSAQEENIKQNVEPWLQPYLQRMYVGKYATVSV